MSSPIEPEEQKELGLPEPYYYPHAHVTMPFDDPEPKTEKGYHWRYFRKGSVTLTDGRTAARWFEITREEYPPL